MRAVAPIVYEPVAVLPSSPVQGTTVVLQSDGLLYTYNGAAWVAAGGSGSSYPTAVTTVDFGSVAKYDVTADVSAPLITPSSVVSAWVVPIATPDHSVDEHLVERVIARGYYSAPSTLRLYVAHALGHRLRGRWSIAWQHT